MNTTFGTSFKNGSNDKERHNRQKMRALKSELAATKLALKSELAATTLELKSELEATKLELVKTQACAEFKIRKLEFMNQIQDRFLDKEIARADAVCIARAKLAAQYQEDARVRAAAGSDLKTACGELSQERACIKFLTMPAYDDFWYTSINHRIFDKFRRTAALKLCILHFWKELYKLEKMKVVEFIYGENDWYSVFKCTKITVLKGPEWRDAMVQLVSTKPAFQCDEADCYKYNPENPTACVSQMLTCTGLRQPQFALDAADGVPENDPIWYKEFCVLF
jgi:hypothetical protein